MVGDRRHGVYNLRITNASLDDDAEYQCQVGPARGHSVIRANALLKVICEYTFFIFLFFILYVLSTFTPANTKMT